MIPDHHVVTRNVCKSISGFAYHESHSGLTNNATTWYIFPVLRFVSACFTRAACAEISHHVHPAFPATPQASDQKDRCGSRLPGPPCFDHTHHRNWPARMYVAVEAPFRRLAVSEDLCTSYSSLLRKLQCQCTPIIRSNDVPTPLSSCLSFRELHAWLGRHMVESQLIWPER
jgi:hypothetical protein